MIRRLHILLMVLATALVAFAGSGCVQPLDPLDPNARDFVFRIYIPNGKPDSKALTGDVASVEYESKLYNLQVWMFNHADPAATGTALDAINAQTAVAYTAVTDIRSGAGWANIEDRSSGYYSQWTDDNTLEVHCILPGYLMDRQDEDLKFDFYVLANQTSIGSPASQAMTRGELKALTFGHEGTTDWYGVAYPRTNVIAGTGLPISGLFLGTNNAGVDLSFLKTTPTPSTDRLPVIQLQRAVSKIRFVFARANGMDNVQIQKIDINGDLIPQKIFVFPRENGQSSLPANSYEGSATTIKNADDTPLKPTASILEVAEPLLLRSQCDTAVTFTLNNVTVTNKKPKEMTAQEYDSWLTYNVGTKTSTEQLVYLRESDKKIKGTIYYSIDGGTSTKTATFEMDADDVNTNFWRNHSWTVYAYFKDDYTLYINVGVKDWIPVEKSTAFTDQVGCNTPVIEGAIETGNNYLDNLSEVGSTSDPNYYSKYYQVRTLKMNVSNPHFVFRFKPFAPLGGYWSLEPVYIGTGSSEKFDIKVYDGETYSDVLVGQIMNMEVEIHIFPKDFDPGEGLAYAMLLKARFSPNINFEPAYSADSEFQDVHGDGRYSYWRFTLAP